MIKILLDDNLKNILLDQNISIKDYIPAYNGESAGLDLYNSGDSISVAHSTYKNITLDSHYQKSKFKTLIPTGLKVIIPKGYVGLIQERGSITKTPLKARAGVIDSGYTGEIFVNCVNISNKNFTIDAKTKLPFQLVVVKCDNEFEVINEEEYLNLSNSSSRKEGKVGSSD